MTEINNITDDQVRNILTTINNEYQKQKISHRKLAEMTGLDRNTINNTINNIINNGPIPKLTTVVKIATALSLKIEIKSML